MLLSVIIITIIIITIISSSSVHMCYENLMPLSDVGYDQSRRLKRKIKERSLKKKRKRRGKHYHAQLKHCVWYECDASFSENIKKQK